MNSRTPIRLTPHRGPLATPPTSPESSPTSSTPPTDLSYRSTASRLTLDTAVHQHRTSTLSPPTRHQPRSPPCRRRREVAKQGLFGSANLCSLDLVFENLFYSVCDLAQALTGIVTFCLLVWGLLEWSSCVSEQPGQPHPSLLIPRFLLPPPTRALRCHVNPSLCEPKDREQHVVLQFLSEQIQHARALSSLSIDLGLPLRAFFEAHRATIPGVLVGQNLTGSPQLVQEVDTLASLTELLDPSLLDFTPGSFIGRSLTLALEELGDLISGPTVGHGSSVRREHQDAHLHAIFWRTTSNLLLEYSAARSRARTLLQQLRVLRQQLSPSVSGHHTAQSIDGGSIAWLWKSGFRHPALFAENGMSTLVSGLETTLHNVHRLVAYLDWITERLAQTTFGDVLGTRRETDFSSCMVSLQELFAQSKPLTPKKLCLCLNDYGFMRPEKVGVMVPGSPTARAGR